MMIKKTINIVSAALVMLIAVSCQKENSVSGEEPIEKVSMTFSATAQGTEKTHVISEGDSEAIVVWSQGDAIKVFTSVTESGDVCNMITEPGNTYAEFNGQCANKGPWTAIYPAYSGATLTNGTIEFAMPDEQTYVPSTFAPGAMPCVAYSESTEFNFKHSFGVLKLRLKLKQDATGSVKSIKITAKGDEKLNGTFKVTPRQGAEAIAKRTDGTSSITLNCITEDYKEGVPLLTSSTTDFWFVVPDGAFKNGFDVEIVSTETGKTAELSTTNDNTVTAGQIRPMQPIEIEFRKPPQEVTDACGITYPVVKIGKQYWMAENMRCNKYSPNSDAEESIRSVDIETSESAVFTHYYAPVTSGKDAIYGYYYNWAAAVGVKDGKNPTSSYSSVNRQGICPDGFHIPGSAEYQTLNDVAAGEDKQPGTHLKSEDGWNEYGDGDNSTGFNAFPAGHANGDEVTQVSEYTYFWTAESDAEEYSTQWHLTYNLPFFYKVSSEYKSVAFSVRCVWN